METITQCQQFLPRDAMLARYYAVAVCLSVCLSQVAVRLKLLNVGSRKQRHTDSPGTLVFFDANNVCQTLNGFMDPKRRRQMQLGRLKFATFDKSLAIIQRRQPSQVYHTQRPPLFAARLP